MKNDKLLQFGIAVVTISVVLFSCKKESPAVTPAITITNKSQTINENAGTITVVINMSAAASGATKLNVGLGGDAIWNGDYSLDSTSSVTIPAGSTSAQIKLTIFNDAVVETDKNILVKFSSSANVTFTDEEATVTINDDDNSQAANGLQMELTWDNGAPVDLDLYIVSNVTIDNGTITDFDLVDGSENETGFESALINNSGADGDYYVLVLYSSGSRAVNYTLISNGPGITNVTTADSFTASDEGNGYFYGPIKKVGSTYSRLTGSTNHFDVEKLKRFIYQGKMLK